jgi:putative flippase GtrA
MVQAVTSHSTRKPEFVLRAVNMEFVVDRLLSQNLGFPVSITSLPSTNRAHVKLNYALKVGDVSHCPCLGSCTRIHHLYLLSKQWWILSGSQSVAVDMSYIFNTHSFIYHKLCLFSNPKSNLKQCWRISFICSRALGIVAKYAYSTHNTGTSQWYYKTTKALILLLLTTMLQIHPSYLGFGMMFLGVMG